MLNASKIMKQIFVRLLFCATVSSGFAQVPNGNFENWQTVDSIENPVYWETNNYYVGYTPVAKTLDALQGTYSMKVSSTAKDVWGSNTGDGCAHVKFVPTETYQYLTASVRIDTVQTNGEVSIRVKQWLPSNGLFEKIGSWKVTTATNGVVQVVLPIEQVGLDTLLIEVWAKNFYDLFTNPEYTEVIIDSLQLKTTLAAQEATNRPFGVIFPNPAIEELNVQLHQAFQKPSTLRVIDSQGRILQSYDFPVLSTASIHLGDIPPGHYFLELLVQGQSIGMERFVVGQ